MKIQNLMKTNNFSRKTAAMVAVVSLGFAISCSQDQTPFQTEAANAAEDAITDYYYEDADDMGSLTLEATPEAAGGKTAKLIDDRLLCATITVTPDSINGTEDNPIGDIVIDFSDNDAGECVDPRGNVRKGKILIHFEGKRFHPGSFFVLTPDGYSINDIQLEGTRTTTNIQETIVSNPLHEIVLTGGKATWPDGSVATKEHCVTREWIRANTPLLDQIIVSQCADEAFAATGVNRRGINYEMSILVPIVHQRGCPLPVSGIKQFVDLNSGKVMTIDFGGGECDTIVTISIDGSSRTVNVGRRG